MAAPVWLPDDDRRCGVAVAVQHYVQPEQEC
jgi:hypothetical protein